MKTQVLDKRNCLAIDSDGQFIIECLEGKIWVTETGCPDDTILSPGDSFMCSRKVLYQFYALENASLIQKRWP